MWVEMRKEVVVDDDNSVDLKQLAPLDKIMTSIRLSFQNTAIVQNRKKKMQQAEYKKQCEEEEALKGVILRIIHSELNNNTFLGPKGLHAEAIILELDRKLEPILHRIRNHKEFMSYDFEVLKPNLDVVKCFPDTPLMIYLRKKKITNELQA